MELLVGHTYSTQEMQTFFHVSKDTWKKKKNILLNHLKNYYLYEIEYNENDWRKLQYTIVEKINDYEPILKKGELRDIIYDKKILNVICCDNLQTAKNVSRIIKNDNEIIALSHTDNTRYEITRVRMRNMFGTHKNDYGTPGYISDKIWCMLDVDNNRYIPLSEEKTKDFFNMFKTEKSLYSQAEIDILADLDNGLLTRKEADRIISANCINAFISAKQSFKIKYGYTPIKVPIYELSAFEHETQEAA